MHVHTIFGPQVHNILAYNMTERFLIEKVHLDDLDLYVITFIVLATSVLL